MKTAEIRERFLSFFENQGHTRIASSSLVPHNDPTLLFTNAGMVQFKDVFTGLEKQNYVRATTSQRCVRAGGKHNDLENVGYTARHHTFFEMLGNFSFGDYFKKEAIHYAWEFLTKELSIPEEKLWITVFEEDDEAANIWLKDIGVSQNQLSRIGAKDNFWSMGDTGPCGPCSEIFYDHGEDVAGGPPGTPEEDGDRYIEIWNLVFMQFDRSADGVLNPLPKPSVDTGMGLERIAAVMQHEKNNYDIDLFEFITASICDIVGSNNQQDYSVRVVADHIRSTAFLIADGVLPGNEGRGYVLRRIIRRAIRHGYKLGGKTPFFYKIVDSLVKQMGEAYPELIDNYDLICNALEKEELRFSETLETGLKIFNQKTAETDGKQVSGDLAFLLYDTYGFPVDLTADVARERDMTVDMGGFEAAMESQRDRARSNSKFGGDAKLQLDLTANTEFCGYESLKQTSTVIAIAHNNQQVETAAVGDNITVILDKTPFYAEGGGQVGDKGILKNNGLKVDIQDTQKLAGDIFAHIGVVIEGDLTVGVEVDATVIEEVRQATARNHSATHLLHAALIEVLGSHVQQKGSLVDHEKLRFDFSHDAPMTREQKTQVEALVNNQVLANNAVQSQIMPVDDAKKMGAAALFGEKYGDEVRTIGMGEFSLELCGGTHVARTGDIGLFKLISESGVASGVRRIEAVSGEVALTFVDHHLGLLDDITQELKSNNDSALAKLAQLQQQIKDLTKENHSLQKTIAEGGGGSGDLESQIIEYKGVRLLASDMAGVDKKVLRETIDKFKSKYDNAIILLASRQGDKVPIVAGVSQTLAKQFPAGKLIQYVTGLYGGRGGGRPDMAEGGIPDDSDIEACLAAAKVWVDDNV